MDPSQPRSSSQPSFNLGEILQGRHVTAHFQPIVSVWKKSIIGFEGLIRGLHPDRAGLIPPVELFSAAAAQGKLMDLDGLCRWKVLQEFRQIRNQEPGALLSLNFEASIIERGELVVPGLLKQVKEAGLAARSIALEIIESNVEDLEALQEFVLAHRSQGFLISLDDVGAGHSNLNRIPLLKPDILKVDRYLVKSIHLDYYKQEVFKSLASLAQKIGAILIAEGVESAEEATACLDMGADMIQGYYFAKPLPRQELDSAEVLRRVETLGESFKRKAIEQLNVKRKNLRRYETMTREILESLSRLEIRQFDEKLAELIRFFPQVECLYVLDEDGIQVSEAVFSLPEESRRNPDVFRPPHKGSDHTLKDYFYMLVESGMRKTTYLSDPCLSMASGNLCVTYALSFQDSAEKKCILCVDINTQYFEHLNPLG